MEQISSDSVLYARRIFVKKERDFYIILNSDRPNITVVDEPGKRIFELCNGRNTVDDIAECVINENQSSNLTKQQVIDFVVSLAKAGFLSTSLPSPMEKEINARNMTLSAAWVHLTHGCNLRCKHCHIWGGVPHEKEMSDERILALIKDLADNGVKRIIITGGEPFLRRKLLYRVIEQAGSRGIEIDLETNGTLITEEDANFLKRLPARALKTSVSLDGANPESNDFVRGTGAFGKTVDGLKLLIKAGVYTCIGMTLMHHNLKEAEAMVNLAKNLGVNQITINTVHMRGRAKENEDLVVSLDDLAPTVKKAWKTAKDAGLRTSVDEFVSSMIEGEIKYSCGVGTNVVSIDANGDVYPCNFFIGGPMKIGNVCEANLREVLEKSPIVKEFRNLTVFDTDCRDCELGLICAGCPAESFEFCQDIKKRTPFCSLRRETTWDVLTNLAHEMWQKT